MNALLPVGDGIFEDDSSVPNADDLESCFNIEDLRHIQRGISETIRPGYQAPPPSNLGEPSHGKLKADVYRTLMEFDIPVSMVELSSRALASEEHTPQKRKLLECTMFLATALCWATSHRTSVKHAEEYMKNMRAYLSSIRELFPNRNLRPNHHSALFIGEMLLRFGPLRGWWCFPFERVIGLLQQINTNSKLGKYDNPLMNRWELTGPSTDQLETTLVNSFCATANLQSFVDGPSCLNYLAFCAPIIEQCYGQDNCGTLMSDMHTLRNVEETSDTENTTWCYDSKDLRPLENDVYNALVTKGVATSGITLGQNVVPHPRYKFAGLQYTPFHVHKKDSTIFFKEPGGQALIPGRIRNIFSVPRRLDSGVIEKNVFFAIHRHREVGEGVSDPFKEFEGFGASVWSSTFHDVEVIQSTDIVCHGILRPWADGLVVLRPLNRVS
jgi:hypothetical protein